MEYPSATNSECAEMLWNALWTLGCGASSEKSHTWHAIFSSRFFEVIFLNLQYMSPSHDIADFLPQPERKPHKGRPLVFADASEACKAVLSMLQVLSKYLHGEQRALKLSCFQTHCFRDGDLLGWESSWLQPKHPSDRLPSSSVRVHFHLAISLKFFWAKSFERSIT